MGIYAGDSIYGIRIYNFNDDDVGNTLFEEKYDEIMSHEQMREAYLFYNELNDKNNLFFKVYLECTSTLDLIHNKKYMNWCSISLNTFLENFNV
jgi:hypothetical protein